VLPALTTRHGSVGLFGPGQDDVAEVLR
jgi:hypothetical protein